MVNRVHQLIKPLTIIAIAIFLALYFMKQPLVFEDYCSYVSYAVSGASLIFLLYEKYLWKLIPWNRPPILKTHYRAEISYMLEGEKCIKQMQLDIKQTWLAVDIKTRTESNSSRTICATITEENGDYFLNYSYLTSPKAVDHRVNPIQYGTCRISLNEENGKFYGRYWNTSERVGDITLFSDD